LLVPAPVPPLCRSACASTVPVSLSALCLFALHTYSTMFFSHREKSAQGSCFSLHFAQTLLLLHLPQYYCMDAEDAERHNKNESTTVREGLKSHLSRACPGVTDRWFV